MSEQQKEAIAILRQGGIVIFPTDTAFGIGCRVDMIATIEKLYAIRRRPLTQAMTLLVDSIQMAQKYVRTIPVEVEKKLIEPYWPGALSIILESNTDRVSGLVSGGTKTIGVRMPDDTSLRDIISAVGVPILGPSANFHGEKTPFRRQDLDPALVSKVEYVLHGKGKEKNVSTVIDCVSTPWKIIRQGAVKLVI